MLLQLLRQDKATSYRKLTLNDVLSQWHAPTPSDVFELLLSEDSSALGKRTIFIIVDGLYNIRNHFGDNQLLSTESCLGELAQESHSFMIVCGTSSVSGPVNRSYRIKDLLPCSPLNPPTINNEPVFKTNELAGKVLISDCGGHGRALEALANVFKTRPAEIGPDFKSFVVERLLKAYDGAIPEESEGLAIVKAALANRRLRRHQLIPEQK